MHTHTHTKERIVTVARLLHFYSCCQFSSFLTESSLCWWRWGRRCQTFVVNVCQRKPCRRNGQREQSTKSTWAERVWYFARWRDTLHRSVSAKKNGKKKDKFKFKVETKWRHKKKRIIDLNQELNPTCHRLSWRVQSTFELTNDGFKRSEFEYRQRQ